MCDSESMIISDGQLARFVKVYKELYNKDLSNAEAYDILIKILNLYKLLNSHFFLNEDFSKTG